MTCFFLWQWPFRLHKVLGFFDLLWLALTPQDEYFYMECVRWLVGWLVGWLKAC